MKKTLIYGILASFFFAFTFILNRSMNLAGGYWMWAASLRYLFVSHIADHAGWELAGQGVERCKGGACLMAGMEYGGIRAVLRASYLWIRVGGILAGRSDLAADHSGRRALTPPFGKEHHGI